MRLAAGRAWGTGRAVAVAARGVPNSAGAGRGAAPHSGFQLMTQFALPIGLSLARKFAEVVLLALQECRNKAHFKKLTYLFQRPVCLEAHYILGKNICARP